MAVSRQRKPIFIVSAPRSGSTLLRLILDAHPRLAVPPPGWLFHFVYPYLYSYGDLDVEENFRELVKDILETPTIKRWPIEISVEKILSSVEDRTFRGVYKCIHVLYANDCGKYRWGVKTPRNSVWIDEIMSLFPDAQIIHLLRDGRDVAIDISDADFLPGTVYASAQVWRNFVSAVKRSEEKLGPESFFEIRYENLCRDPERELGKLCEFLGEEFSDHMLSHYEFGSSAQWSKDPRHAETARPINTDFVDMYKTRLRKPDLDALNSLLGDMLHSFGYLAEGNSAPLKDTEVFQLFEHDTITTSDSVEYKKWHRRRRTDRRNRGIWKDADKNSLLWGFD